MTLTLNTRFNRFLGEEVNFFRTGASMASLKFVYSGFQNADYDRFEGYIVSRLIDSRSQSSSHSLCFRFFGIRIRELRDMLRRLVKIYMMIHVEFIRIDSKFEHFYFKRM